MARSTKLTVTPLQGLNGQLMILAACRYCLGRRSYIVGCCQEWLTAQWDLVNEDTRANIVRDIVVALMNDEAGEASDYKTWQYFAYWAWKQLTEEKCNWIKNGVAFYKKEWPI